MFNLTHYDYDSAVYPYGAETDRFTNNDGKRYDWR